MNDPPILMFMSLNTNQKTASLYFEWLLVISLKLSSRINSINSIPKTHIQSFWGSCVLWDNYILKWLPFVSQWMRREEVQIKSHFHLKRFPLDGALLGIGDAAVDAPGGPLPSFADDLWGQLWKIGRKKNRLLGIFGFKLLDVEFFTVSGSTFHKKVQINVGSLSE